jgi:biopolymer transport protein ExbD
MRNPSASLRSRRPSAVAGVADLDVTPVMNMFIILIPFLISMAAFTRLAAQDFSLPGNEEPEHTTERVDLPLTVAVGVAGLLVVQGDVVVAELPRLDSGQDLPGLTSVLRRQAPVRLVVAIDNPVTTAEIVACLDACRAAGCSDVGLAAGTGVVLSGKVES